MLLPTNSNFFARPPPRPLPRLRFFFLISLAITSAISLAMSAVVLNFTLENSGTFLKSNPEVVVSSGFSLVCLFFTLGIGRHSFFTHVWCELVWMGIAWFMYMGGTSTLNSQTPGLITHSCGEYFFCRGLLVMLIFSALSLLLLTLLFFPILIISVLQHVKKTGHARGVWKSKVEDWERWDGGWSWEGRKETRRRTMIASSGGNNGNSTNTTRKSMAVNNIGKVTVDNPFVLDDTDEDKLKGDGIGDNSVSNNNNNSSSSNRHTYQAPKGLAGEPIDNPFTLDAGRAV